MKKLVTLLILLSSTIFSGYKLPDADAYYKSGLAKLKSKQYMDAIGDFTNAISLRADFSSAYYQRARAKDLLAKQYGFENSELCFDLSQALRLGNMKAARMLESSCMGECYGPESDVFKNEPEIIFCADFSFKRLTNLPSTSYKMTNLVKLNFMGNKATQLSSSLGKLNNLIILDLSSNGLTSLNPAIGRLSKLKDLTLNKNNLSNLPAEFGNLKNLKNLYIRQNKLQTLPTSIAKLKNLETLDLSMNQLTSLPLHISGLKNLKTLMLAGNDIKKKERQNIQALLPNTKIYFE